MRSRKVPAAALAVAMVVGIAGCTTTTSGTASPAPVANPSLSLGPLRTVDLCSLVAVKDLARFGNTDTKLVDSFDSCEYLVIGKGLSALKIDVRDDDNLTQQQLAEAGARVHHQDGLDYSTATSAGPNDCHASITTADHTWLQFLASGVTSASLGAGMCPAVDAAVQSAIGAIRDGKVTHRTYPRGSWGDVDMCTLLDEQAVRSAPGVDAGVQVSYSGGHICSWGMPLEGFVTGPAIKPMVRVTLALGSRPAGADAQFARTVAGRPGMVKPHAASTTERGYPVPPDCSAVVIGPQAQAKGDANHADVGELYEAADIDVYGTQPPDQLCALATALGERAFPKLPA